MKTREEILRKHITGHYVIAHKTPNEEVDEDYKNQSKEPMLVDKSTGEKDEIYTEWYDCHGYLSTRNKFCSNCGQPLKHNK